MTEAGPVSDPGLVHALAEWLRLDPLTTALLVGIWRELRVAGRVDRNEGAIAAERAARAALTERVDRLERQSDRAV